MYVPSLIQCFENSRSGSKILPAAILQLTRNLGMAMKYLMIPDNKYITCLEIFLDFQQLAISSKILNVRATKSPPCIWKRPLLK